MSVVTGIGVVAPTGVGAAAHWAATLAGKSGIDRIGRFDPDGYTTRLAGEVPGFDPVDHVPERLIKQTDRMTHLALAATGEALADAGRGEALPYDTYDMGVVTANACSGLEFGQAELEKLFRRGPLHVSAYMSIAWFYAATTGQLSIRHGMRGPCGLVSTEQAGGLDAIGHARRQLRRGTRLMVTGGSDAPVTPAGLVAQMTTRRLSPAQDPARGYLPFDARAFGYVPGEGAAMLVLEDPAAARERGARPYGVIAGCAATFDPPRRSGRPPALSAAVERALACAHVRPGEIDVVFADGYGVPDLDRVEAEALAAVFGPRGVPVTVPKTMTGRMYGAAGALDVVSALLAIRDGVIPPTVNVTELAPGPAVDLVGEVPRDADVRRVLVIARGHGGYNAAAVVRAAEHHDREGE